MWSSSKEIFSLWNFPRWVRWPHFISEVLLVMNISGWAFILLLRSIKFCALAALLFILQLGRHPTADILYSCYCILLNPFMQHTHARARVCTYRPHFANLSLFFAAASHQDDIVHPHIFLSILDGYIMLLYLIFLMYLIKPCISPCRLHMVFQEISEVHHPCMQHENGHFAEAFRVNGIVSMCKILFTFNCRLR